MSETTTTASRQRAIVSDAYDEPFFTVMYGSKVTPFAPRTLQVLTDGWTRWCRACELAGLPPIPANNALLIDVVKRHIESKKKRSSIETTLLYPIRTASRRLGHADPTDNTEFRDFWKHACRDILTKRQKQAIGMTEDVVRSILATLSPSRPRDAMIGAMIGLAYDGLLRISEISSLRLSHIRAVRGDAGEMLIERSKTDQDGAGSTRSISPETMKWISAHRAFADQRCPEEDWLFPSPYRSGRQPISTRQIAKLIETGGKLVGVEGLSGHSGRVGGAQDMMLSGATLAQMQKRGGWKTVTMPARYAEHADTTLDGEERRRQLGRLAERRKMLLP
ncbi:MAG: hypothetical protein DDT34_01675 [Firmicutes bacterium]|nr:hypothetical protein [Bacillota bacterium]MBT9165357.1 hypothetical protein [Chloroflexota bacterium]